MHRVLVCPVEMAEIEDREDVCLIFNEREDYNGKTQNPLAGPA